MTDETRVDDGAFVQKLMSDPSAVEKSFRRFAGLMAYYRCAMMEIETKFNVLNQEFSLRYDRNPIQDIRTRLKSPESVIRKLRKKGVELSADSIEENLADVAGVRVICSFLADVYLLADALLSQDDITLIEKKDYIKNPKPNGYRSLHLIVTVPIFLAQKKQPMKVEIQLRTLSRTLGQAWSISSATRRTWNLPTVCARNCITAPSFPQNWMPKWTPFGKRPISTVNKEKKERPIGSFFFYQFSFGKRYISSVARRALWTG